MLDTGSGEKLEKFGSYTLSRPYEGAVWQKTLKREWQDADGRFSTSKEAGKSGWKLKKTVYKKWEMSYKGIKFSASPTPFRHLGFFPEQAVHWDFIEKEIEKAGQASKLGRPIRFLNLFGYTGVASLFALRAGAEVTHVDASKQTLTLAKENQRLSVMENLPMRVICDDALKFMEREEKRGNRYDCIIMDPPKFGRGPKDEVWKLEENMSELLSSARNLLSDTPVFIILTSYATNSSSLSLGYALSDAMAGLKGEVESGELCLQEESCGRLVSLANTAIWQKI